MKKKLSLIIGLLMLCPLIAKADRYVNAAMYGTFIYRIGDTFRYEILENDGDGFAIQYDSNIFKIKESGVYDIYRDDVYNEEDYKNDCTTIAKADIDNEKGLKKLVFSCGELDEYWHPYVVFEVIGHSAGYDGKTDTTMIQIVDTGLYNYQTIEIIDSESTADTKPIIDTNNNEKQNDETQNDDEQKKSDGNKESVPKVDTKEKTITDNIKDNIPLIAVSGVAFILLIITIVISCKNSKLKKKLNTTVIKTEE